MSLTGKPLLFLAIAVAVAIVAATVLLAPRVRGPLPLRIAQRALMVLASQVAAIAVVAVALNDANYFYGSWADLVGTSVTATGESPVINEATRPHAVVLPRWRASTALSGSGAPVAGRLLEATVTGARSGLHTTAYVYLPPQYDATARTHTRIPAVLVMTGYPGNARNLVVAQNYPHRLDSAMRTGRVRPMALVMVDPAPVLPRDTECTDVPGGPQVATFLGQDLPFAVSSTLRVRQIGWGVSGDSTGGYCATKLAMLDPSMFPAAVSMSGYYHTLHDSTTGDLWGRSALLRGLNDPLWRLKHLPAPPISVLATVGASEHDGSLGVDETRRLVAAARRPMTVTTIIVPHGGHNFTDWAQVIEPGFAFLFAHLG